MADTVDDSMRAAIELHRAGRIPETIRAYEDIVSRWPGLAAAWYNLGISLRQLGDFQRALLAYQNALATGISRPEEVHLNRAVIYSDFLHDHESATAELQRALSLDQNYIPALLNLGNLYEDLGKRPEAAAQYARILAINPRANEALARFVNVQRTEDIDDALIARVETALNTATLMSERATLGFALGRLLDAKGYYRRAFSAYEAANRASRASVEGSARFYDRAEQHAIIDRLISMRHSAAQPRPTHATPKPLFIVGLFRSGSTLTEQLLSAVPGVVAGGELNALPHLASVELPQDLETLADVPVERFEALAVRYQAELARISPSAQFVTDKRPDNFLRIGLIKSMFPDTKIVHTTRHPLDICLSNYFLHLDPRMSYALNLGDIGHYYREYRRLMAFWKDQFGADIYDFDYDALVADPAGQYRALCEFLGLEWPGRVPQVATRGAAIRTASVWQVREPLYRTSSGRHLHYADELTALRAELADFL